MTLALAPLCAFAVDGIPFVAHRGECAIAPENTIAAFQATIDAGGSAFECDLHLTIDNEIVIMHDGNTGTTTDSNLVISASTLAQLKALDAGYKKGAAFIGERIPTLQETLVFAQDGRKLFLEIKCGVGIMPRLMPRLVEIIAATPAATPENIVFICFDEPIIAEIRQQFPTYQALLLLHTQTQASHAITAAKRCDATGIDMCDGTVVNSNFVAAVHAEGLSFHVWNVNNVSDFGRAVTLLSYGVESVTSNNAGHFAGLLASIISNIGAYHTMDQMRDMQPGFAFIEAEPSTGNFNLTMQLQTKESLNSAAEWQPLPLAPTAVETLPDGKIQLNVPPVGNTGFYRLKAADL